ncbi:MAG: N-acetylmuramoyl-L-alanine amidase [Candidatus Acidiferrales bacterium]
MPSQTEPQKASPPQEPASTSAASRPSNQPAASPQSSYNPMIVLDPAHGGTDTGARGETGAIEKDLVLDYARMTRAELQSEGFHVVMTRDDDSNPSYADRAAIANSYRTAIFISLHISTTGTFGTIHTYYYQFGSAPAPPSEATSGKTASATERTTSLVPWEDAQVGQVGVSARLAAALQAQFAERFGGSPASAAPAAVRELRSVDAPAVAIEVASVSVKDPNSLAAQAGPIAVAIARGVQAFRTAVAAGAH